MCQYRPTLLLTGRIFLPSHPSKPSLLAGLQYYNHPLWGSTSLLYKPGLEFFLLSQLVMGNFPRGHRFPLRGKRQCGRSMDCRNTFHSLLQLICAFSIYLSLISYIPLPSNDWMLLWRPDFMAWRIRQHLVHDGKLILHSNLVTHGQSFSL